jgi:hypothetical protein
VKFRKHHAILAGTIGERFHLEFTAPILTVFTRGAQRLTPRFSGLGFLILNTHLTGKRS